LARSSPLADFLLSPVFSLPSPAFLRFLTLSQILNCVMIYDIIRLLLAKLGPLEVELLLLLLSRTHFLCCSPLRSLAQLIVLFLLLSFSVSDCGQQLRKDDPRALKEVILLVQKQAKLLVSVSLFPHSDIFVSFLFSLLSASLRLGVCFVIIIVFVRLLSREVHA
jgi:hypothetical protein